MPLYLIGESEYANEEITLEAKSVNVPLLEEY